MAKKKKEAVDLKPTSVTDEQLKSIQAIVSQINQYNLFTKFVCVPEKYMKKKESNV